MIAALNVDKLRLDMGDYVLSVQSLRKRFGVRSVLAGVDIDVKRGAFSALIGPAGAGKSVTLGCIAGAFKPSAGRIRYFGYEIKGRSPERIVRMGIARTHQPAQLFAGMTVLETLTVGALLRRPRLARARAHARELLAPAGLAGRSQARADRLDEAGRRRLELACALATEPQLLLLDDIWAGLDPSAAATLVPLIDFARARGTTILAAARTLDALAAQVDDVVEIDRGKTAEMALDAPVDLRV